MLTEEGAPVSGLAPMKRFQMELKPCFGSWGDTKRTKAGLPGHSQAGFGIPAPMRALKDTPRGSAGSCFLPKALLPWGPQDEAPRMSEGAASGWEGSPERPWSPRRLGCEPLAGSFHHPLAARISRALPPTTSIAAQLLPRRWVSQAWPRLPILHWSGPEGAGSKGPALAPEQQRPGS